MKSHNSSIKLRLLLSFTALFFGVIVLTISLVSTNQAESYSEVFGTNKKMYFHQSLLPDHLLYPVVAAADNFLLMIAPQQNKIDLELTYAKIRLEYAWGLLEKKDHEQALATLTKSQKYYYSACSNMMEQAFNNHSPDQAIKALEFSIQQSDNLLQQINSANKELANQLNNNNQLLLEKIKQI